MAFVNYKTENNVYSYLAIALSSDATTMQVNDGDIFPASWPFILTIEHYDDDWNCVKREIVKWTARDNNTITIVRAFEECVADDTANPKTLQQSPFNFVAWDSVSLTLTSELITDIQNEITRQNNQYSATDSCLQDMENRMDQIETDLWLLWF